MYMVKIRDKEMYGDSIVEGSCFLSNSLPCDELTVDTLKVTLDGTSPRGTRFVPRGSTGLLTSHDEVYCVRPYLRILVHDLSLYTYGEAVEYYHNSMLIGKFYMDKPKRVGRHIYEISCVSAVGLLDSSTHYGGIYSGQTVSAVMANIIDGTVPYALDLELEAIPVYGWLPVASRRENLQQLLFATGISLRKSNDGVLRFTVLTDDTATGISNDRIFLGGDVDYKTPATSAEVTEHAYLAYTSDELVTLYEGEVPAEPIVTPAGESVMGALVLFSEPMHDLVATNVSVLESGVNYAVLGASPDGLLTGKKYTHTTRIIKSGGVAAANDNVVRVTDATLVSLANSENVAKRVYAYYGKTTVIGSDIVVGDERPGDSISFRDPFDEHREAFVQSLDITMSNVLRASAKFASGYKPTGVGNFYTRSDLLAVAGTWTVPAGVYKIRAVLISGGTGGNSGGNGKKGDGSAFDTSMKNGGAGGVGGPAAQGGKILTVTIPVTPGQVLNFSPGVGGIGAVATGEEPASGSLGSDTTFGAYSSALGRPSEKGFVDIFGKGAFGMPGVAGYGGGNGSGKNGVGNSIVVDGISYTAGGNGANESNSHGSAQGGAGGGAGYGSNGGNGYNGDVYFQPAVNPPPTGWWYAQGGAGGKGGDGQNGANASSYGSAGGAGHGGGGGGAGGGASGGDNGSFGGPGGAGGKGGTGGNGGAGCALIYY